MIIGIVLFVVVIAAGAISAYAWHASTQPKPTKQLPGAGCQAKTRNDVVVFYYKPDTSIARQQEIITSIGGTVERSYDSLHGYSVKITGSQTDAISKLKSYPEVTSVSADQTSCLL